MCYVITETRIYVTYFPNTANETSGGLVLNLVNVSSDVSCEITRHIRQQAKEARAH